MDRILLLWVLVWPLAFKFCHCDGNRNDVGCGELLAAYSGKITSPNFPSHYPPNLNCTWTILLPVGNVIDMELEFIDVEYSTGCIADRLAVYDGSDVKSHEIGRFCGTKLFPVDPTSHVVTINFISDSLQSGRGFLLSWNSTKLETETPSPRRCGTSVSTSRIIGGTFAKKYAFPWQAGIVWRKGISRGEQFCGGSLIHPHFVLTAAHCFENGRRPEYYVIRLGDHDISSVDGTEQVFNVTSVHIHDGYNDVTYDNDIALLQLEKPATINDFVNTLCLPSILDVEVPGSRCIVTGWGSTGGDTKSSNILMEAEVPIVDRSTCRHKDSYGDKITIHMFCAGYASGEKDSCQGDSGGPIQCKKGSDQMILLGITSWGRGCGSKLKYGIYTTVRYYIPWIELMISLSGVDTSVPTESTEELLPPTLPVFPGSSSIPDTEPAPGTPVVPGTAPIPDTTPEPDTSTAPDTPPVPDTEPDTVEPYPLPTQSSSFLQEIWQERVPSSLSTADIAKALSANQDTAATTETQRIPGIVVISSTVILPNKLSAADTAIQPISSYYQLAPTPQATPYTFPATDTLLTSGTIFLSKTSLALLKSEATDKPLEHETETISMALLPRQETLAPVVIRQPQWSVNEPLLSLSLATNVSAMSVDATPAASTRSQLASLSAYPQRTDSLLTFPTHSLANVSACTSKANIVLYPASVNHTSQFLKMSSAVKNKTDHNSSSSKFAGDALLIHLAYFVYVFLRMT